MVVSTITPCSAAGSSSTGADWINNVKVSNLNHPWQDEALSVALHKPNIYIDLSGWSPKYFPPQLVQYANSLLKNRVLFGTDFPLITPERWMKDFAEAAFREEVKPLILKENAAKMLRLGQAEVG